MRRRAPQRPHRVTLAQLGIQPIDFVSLVINRAGADGRRHRARDAGRSCLPARARHRRDKDRAASRSIPVAGAGELTFAQLFPARASAARAARRVPPARRARFPARCRAARSRRSPSTRDNPDGYDVGRTARSRRQRADRPDGAGGRARRCHGAASVDLVLRRRLRDRRGRRAVLGSAGDAFDDARGGQAAHFTDTGRRRDVSALLDAEALPRTLRRLPLFGISDALPTGGRPHERRRARRSCARAPRRAPAAARRPPRTASWTAPPPWSPSGGDPGQVDRPPGDAPARGGQVCSSARRSSCCRRSPATTRSTWPHADADRRAASRHAVGIVAGRSGDQMSSTSGCRGWPACGRGCNAGTSCARSPTR